MNYARVKEIMHPDTFSEDGSLDSMGVDAFDGYLIWDKGAGKATLDGEFTADELEAIAWWMRHGKT